MSTRVVPLALAEINLQGQYNPPSFADTRIVVNAFLISDQDTYFLVDTGVGEGNGYVDEQFDPVRRSLAAALREHDVDVQDIAAVINSHLHFDHCGNNALFSHTPTFVQRDELAVARKGAYTVREWFDFDQANLVALDGEHALTPNVTLLPTPGHTPGHQSVVVRTASAQILIAAQAAFDAAEYNQGGAPAVQAHDGLEAAYTASLERLRAIAARCVYFSHERHLPQRAEDT